MPMDSVRFNALLALPTLGRTRFRDVDWANLDLAQFNQLLARVPAGVKDDFSGMWANRPQPNQFLDSDVGFYFENVVDHFGLSYKEYGPVWYFKYFMKEAQDAGDRSNCKEAFNMIFDKVPAAAGPAIDGNKLVLKNALTPQEGSANAPHAPYHFAAANGALTWREALKKLMVLGFKCVQQNQMDPVGASLQNAMLEQRFVEYIAPAQHGGVANPGVKIFWRCDTRSFDQYIGANVATAHVDNAESARRYNLTEAWSPFSDPTINDKLWLRQAYSRDNDYFTIVSVGVDFRTVSAFPTLDERKAYTWRAGSQTMSIAPLDQWTKAELQQFKDYLALVSVTLPHGGPYDRVRLCTKVYSYMAAFNRGVVINTQQWGGGSSFPERAIRSMPTESCIGYIPMLRVHHGPARQDGFTLFPVPGEAPRLLLTDGELNHRFGGAAAAAVRGAFDAAVQQVTMHHLRTAWAGDGFQDPTNHSVIHSIKYHPPVLCEAPGAVTLT
jgi:hypothetical protein